MSKLLITAAVAPVKYARLKVPNGSFTLPNLLVKLSATASRDSHLGRRDKKQKQSYLCRIAQGGYDKNNGECRLSLSPVLL